MEVGVRGVLLGAAIGAMMSFGALADDVPERFPAPAQTQTPEVEEPAAAPEQQPEAKSPERAKRQSKAEAKAEARKAKAERRAARRGDAPVAPAEGEALAPLTVRAPGGYGDALSAQLTLRDMARKERRMTPVLAAPSSLQDRPAPALPSGKQEVDEVGDEPEPAAPLAPRAPDAPTTRVEAEYLIRQTPRVMMHCFPASLRQVLARMAKHFNSQVIVTSGFRAGGRRHSLHRACKAADIQIAGVRPSQIVGYAQLQDEVGGIGTYRHTRSVHVDVREQKISWYGNRGRSHFRLAKNQFGTN